METFQRTLLEMGITLFHPLTSIEKSIQDILLTTSLGL